MIILRDSARRPARAIAPEAVDHNLRPRPAGPAPRHWRWRWLGVLLALAAGLIVCHGCHQGGHDDDLGVFLRFEIKGQD